MKRETKSLLVTGCFLAILLALIGAGLVPMNPEPDHPFPAEVERRVSDAQFSQYLEYRARLENSIDCQ